MCGSAGRVLCTLLAVRSEGQCSGECKGSGGRCESGGTSPCVRSILNSKSPKVGGIYRIKEADNAPPCYLSVLVESWVSIFIVLHSLLILLTEPETGGAGVFCAHRDIEVVETRRFSDSTIESTLNVPSLCYCFCLIRISNICVKLGLGQSVCLDVIASS